jgi:hypothetical protein
VFERLTRIEQPRKQSGVIGRRNNKKDGAGSALGFRKAANQIKTQNNTLATSTSGTSLGFHAGKVNQTIHSSREHYEDSNS